jgi:hypothetical protein
MLNFEAYGGDLNGKRKLYSIIPWLEDKTGFNLLEREAESINVLKYQKLKDKALKITVGENQYIKVPNLVVKSDGNRFQIFYTGMSNSNYTIKNNDISVYNDRPRELWIDFNNNEIKFNKYNRIFRTYYINVINENDMSLQKYYIYIILNYKNNGTIGNKNYDFDVDVSCRKIDNINVAYGAIDLAFIGYVVWGIVNILTNNNSGEFIKKIVMEPSAYVILLSYISQLWFRTKYISNTKLNLMFFLLKKAWYKYIKRKAIYNNFLTNRNVIKEINGQYENGKKGEQNK